MDRCLALLGLMAFTVGVVALASQAHPAPRPLEEEAASPTRPALRLPLFAGPAYHVRLSLN